MARDRVSYFKIGDLSQGMDPCIGPRRPDQMNFLSGDPMKDLLDRLLDGSPVRLTLPAGKSEAVILDG